MENIYILLKSKLSGHNSDQENGTKNVWLEHKFQIIFSDQFVNTCNNDKYMPKMFRKPPWLSFKGTPWKQEKATLWTSINELIPMVSDVTEHLKFIQLQRSEGQVFKQVSKF